MKKLNLNRDWQIAMFWFVCGISAGLLVFTIKLFI